MVSQDTMDFNLSDTTSPDRMMYTIEESGASVQKLVSGKEVVNILPFPCFVSPKAGKTAPSFTKSNIGSANALSTMLGTGIPHALFTKSDAQELSPIQFPKNHSDLEWTSDSETPHGISRRSQFQTPSHGHTSNDSSAQDLTVPNPIAMVNPTPKLSPGVVPPCVQSSKKNIQSHRNTTFSEGSKISSLQASSDSAHEPLSGIEDQEGIYPNFPGVSKISDSFTKCSPKKRVFSHVDESSFYLKSSPWKKRNKSQSNHSSTSTTLIKKVPSTRAGALTKNAKNDSSKGVLPLRSPWPVLGKPRNMYHQLPHSNSDSKYSDTNLSSEIQINSNLDGTELGTIDSHSIHSSDRMDLNSDKPTKDGTDTQAITLNDVDSDSFQEVNGYCKGTKENTDTQHSKAIGSDKQASTVNDLDWDSEMPTKDDTDSKASTVNDLDTRSIDLYTQGSTLTTENKDTQRSTGPWTMYADTQRSDDSGTIDLDTQRSDDSGTIDLDTQRSAGTNLCLKIESCIEPEELKMIHNLFLLHQSSDQEEMPKCFPLDEHPDVEEALKAIKSSQKRENQIHHTKSLLGNAAEREGLSFPMQRSPSIVRKGQ